MNLRLLGIAALLGAPFLCIMFLTTSAGGGWNSMAGLYSLLYMGGWTCSIIGLWKLNATGENRWGRIVLLIQLLFLTLANVSNIMLITQTGLSTRFYFILDLFWPISNIWMLAVGITAIVAKRLHGWARFVPLTVGCWFPFCMLLFMVLGKTAASSVYLGGAYSILAWSVLGLIVYRAGSKTYLLPQLV